jgi:hypothetical protein
MFPSEDEGPDAVLFNKTERKHIFRKVTDLLKLKSPETWIGRGSPMIWPPLSPELTSLYFPLGCYCVRAIIGKHLAETCWEDDS